MAEDLNIKVKVTPDTSGVQGELSKLSNALNIPVSFKLENLENVKNQIEDLARDYVSVGVHAYLIGRPDISDIQEGLQDQTVDIRAKVNLDMDESEIAEIQTKLNEISKKLKLNLKVADKKNLTGKLEETANKMETSADKIAKALEVKLGKSVKITQKTISAISKDIGELERKISGIKDTDTKNKLNGELDALKGSYSELLTAGTGSVMSFDGLMKDLSGLKAEYADAASVEDKFASKQEKLQSGADKIGESFIALQARIAKLKTDMNTVPDAYKTNELNTNFAAATNTGAGSAMSAFNDAQSKFNSDKTKENLSALKQAYQNLVEVVTSAEKSVTSANAKIEKDLASVEQRGATLSTQLSRLTARANEAETVNNTIGSKNYTGLLGDSTYDKVVDALTKAQQAKAAFEQDMTTSTLDNYTQAVEQLSIALGDFSKSATSATSQVESAFDRLPSAISSVESTLKTLNDTYRAQQNRGKSDAGVEQTIQMYTNALTRMRQIEGQSGTQDYKLFTDMFKEFTPQLQKAGVEINTFSDFLQAMTSVATQAKVSIGDLGNEFKQQQSIESLNKRLNNLLYTMERYVEINKKIQGNSGVMNQYNSVKSDIQSALRSTDGAFKESTLSKAAEGFSALKKQAQDLGLEGKTLSQVFQNLFGQHFSTMVAMGALHLMQNSLQQVYQNVVDIDTAMTELKKVTDETSSTYSKFLSDAGNQAKELGASVSDVVSATADFARLGYNLQDANEIAESAIMFNRVGDGVSDVNEASEDIISAMKAFNIEAENSQQIVDKYNEVGNNYAISSAGVADALTRSAAALHAAGNDINQSIGMIVAANDVAQSPEQVGNALKVLSLRIRGATTELEAMGEDADGAATSTAKLQAEIKALSGVNIMKDRDTFKSTYEILDELADKWDSLTDVSKASILEDLAGKNRASVVAGMLENWDDAKKAMETAQKSAGSAEAELETALDSVQGKLSQFQATFQSFSETVLDSDLVKGIIDFGTSALDAADGFTKWAGVIPTLTAALSAFLSLSGTKTQGSIQMLAYAVGIAA